MVGKNSNPNKKERTDYVLYQIGMFGYNEGDVEPNVVLEHEKNFSVQELTNILQEIKSKNHFVAMSEETLSEILCTNYGFVAKETQKIDVQSLW